MKADLEWFRTFKAVFETGTMSGAAKLLNISQPGVSLHLNSLEAYIGHPLFERTTRKLVPTGRAKILYQQLFYSLAKLEEVEHSFQKKGRKDRATLSVGIFPGLYHQILEPFLSSLPFNLVIYLDNNDKLQKLLESDTVDVIITVSSHAGIPNVEYSTLGKSQHILVAGRYTDLSAMPDKNDHNAFRKWLLAQTWFNTIDRTHLNVFWKLNFKRDPGFTPNYLLPNKYTILTSLARNSGLAILPDSLCRDAIEQGRLKYVWKGYNDMKKTFYFASRKKTFLQDEIKMFKELVQEKFDHCHPYIE